MRISFNFAVQFVDVVTGEELPTPHLLHSLKMADVDLDTYLDSEIADEGVVGGEVYLALKNGQPRLEVSYWHTSLPTNQLIESLQAYTIAQLDDGIGEGGFECEIHGKLSLIVADTDEFGIVEVYDDGRKILGAPGIAIASRDGDISRLAAEIEAEPQTIDRLHQGCTALHLAILYGHSEAVRELLVGGANPNLTDSQGVTPLEACALSNALDDEQSREIGQLLLNAGANPKHDAPNGESAKSYAESRGKELLAAIL